MKYMLLLLVISGNTEYFLLSQTDLFWIYYAHNIFLLSRMFIVEWQMWSTTRKEEIKKNIEYKDTGEFGCTLYQVKVYFIFIIDV